MACWGAGEGIPLPPRHPKARKPALASSNANDHLWQHAPVEQTKGAGPGVGWVGEGPGASAPPNRAGGPLPHPPPPSFLALGVRLASERPGAGAGTWRCARLLPRLFLLLLLLGLLPPPPRALLPARWSLGLT